MKRTDKFVILAAGLIYLPWITLGYGSDSDTYGVLAAGRHLLQTGQYIPSRHPGFPVFELATLLLDQVGGYLLTNFASLLMALWAGLSVQRLCVHWRIAGGTALSALMFLHPLFLIHATSTHDHIWALALLLGGLERVVRGHPGTAVLLLGLSIGTRFTSVLGLAGVLLIMNAGGHAGREVRRVGLAGLGLGLIWYLLPCAHSGWTLEFMRHGLGDDSYWTPLLKLGKFGYKHIRFWGLPTLVPLAWFGLRCLSRRARGLPREQRPLAAALGVTIALYEGFFLIFPVEPAYLLPVLPLTLMLMGLLGLDRKLTVMIAAGFVLTAGLQFDLARPDVPGRARSANLGFWTSPGALVRDAEFRVELRDCPDLPCIYATLQSHGAPSAAPSDRP